MAENCTELHLAHKAANVVNGAAKLANSQSSKTRTHRAEKLVRRLANNL